MRSLCINPSSQGNHEALLSLLASRPLRSSRLPEWASRNRHDTTANNVECAEVCVGTGLNIIYTCVYMYVCMHVCIYGCRYVDVCKYTRMHVCIRRTYLQTVAKLLT